MIWPLLRTRRWLGFTVLVVSVIIAFGLLSAWQWSRAEDRRTERAELLAMIDSRPQTLADGIRTEPATPEWSPIIATGRYLPDAEVLVRKRPLEARNGFWVLTPLQTGTGTVWVNRGWIPVGSDALDTPDIPRPPSGDVTVSGYLRIFEPADPARNEGLPDRQVAAPAEELLPDVSAMSLGYMQLASSDPEQADVRALPLPEVDDSRNISYAVQWLLFAAVALAGWFFFLRREAREDALNAEQSGAPHGS